MIEFIPKLVILIFVSFFGTSAFAQGVIEITNINMPEVPPVSRTAAIYFTLHNHSKSELKLIGVSTGASRHAMVHHTQEINGMAKMQHIDELVIPPETKLEFSTGGYHIMLMGLEQKLISKSFNVTLEFANQPAKVFRVENIQRNNL